MKTVAFVWINTSDSVIARKNS